MKKAVIAFLLLFSVIFVGCGNNDGNVVALEVCDEFAEIVTYVGEDINFDNYTLTVTLANGDTEIIPLSEANIIGLDTSVVGTQTIKIEYKNKSIFVEFVVYEVIPFAGTYKGAPVEFYMEEQAELSDKYITVLYTNGEEREISLSLAEVGEIDYTLTEDTKQLAVTYEGVEVSVAYVTTYRKIEDGAIYKYESETLTGEGEYKFSLEGETAKIYREEGENLVVVDSFTLERGEYNKYIRRNQIVNKRLVDVEICLVNDTVYCRVIGE